MNARAMRTIRPVAAVAATCVEAYRGEDAPDPATWGSVQCQARGVPGRLASIVEPRLAGIGVALMLLGAGAAWLGLWPGLLWIGLAWGSMGLWLAHAFAIAPLYSDSCDCAEYTELGAEI